MVLNTVPYPVLWHRHTGGCINHFSRYLQCKPYRTYTQCKNLLQSLLNRWQRYHMGAQQAFNLNPLPVPMALHPATFTENFADIANWSDFFITGTGANHWDGLSAVGSGGIPNGTTLTTATNQFIAGNPGTNGGGSRGTEQVSGAASQSYCSQQVLPITPLLPPLIFYADFTGVNAGTLSLITAPSITVPVTGVGFLRVYGSVDGISYTEITNVIPTSNNTPLSDSKTNIPLPAAFNNNANARIRFIITMVKQAAATVPRQNWLWIMKITAIASPRPVAPSAPATCI